MASATLTGNAVFSIINPLSVNVASVYSMYWQWIDGLIAFSLFFSIAHWVFTKHFARKGESKSREGTMVAIALGAALAFAFVTFEQYSGFRFGGPQMQSIAGIIFLSILSVLLYSLLENFLGPEKKKCAFAASFFITHSILLSTFSPLYAQITQTAPIIIGILAVGYLLAMVQVLICMFGMFGGGGGDSHGGGHGSNSHSSSNNSSNKGSGKPGFFSRLFGNKNTNAGANGQTGGQNGPLQVRLNWPTNGLNLQIGDAGRLQADVMNNDGMYVWRVDPPFATPVQGRGGGMFSRGVETNIVFAVPGQHTITLTVQDKNTTVTANASVTVIPGGVIAGIAVDKTGAPLGNIVVTLTPLNSVTPHRSNLAVELKTTTKADGKFKFENVPMQLLMVIRAMNGEIPGIVAVPSTQRINNPFQLSRSMPQIVDCSVVFPEYEYTKPSLKVKSISGIPIADKSYATAIPSKLTVDVVIEVKPGNGFKIAEADRRKKLSAKAFYIDKETGRPFTLLMAVKDGDAGFKFTAEDKLNKKPEVWEYTCAIAMTDVPPRALAYGDYHFEVEIKDDRGTEAKGDGEFTVIPGGGIGGSSRQKLSLKVETVNGVIVPPMFDSVPTTVPGGDIGVIQGVVTGGTPSISGYCILYVVAAVVEIKKRKVRYTLKNDVKEFDEEYETEPVEYIYGKMTTAKSTAIPDPDNANQHILQVTADFAALRKSVPSNTDTRKHLRPYVAIQMFIEDSSNPKQETGNQVRVLPEDFKFANSGSGGGSGGGGSGDGSGKFTFPELHVTVIDRFTNPAAQSYVAPFDITLGVYRDAACTLPAYSIPGNKLEIPVPKGESMEKTVFEEIAQIGIPTDLWASLTWTKVDGTPGQAITAFTTSDKKGAFGNTTAIIFQFTTPNAASGRKV